MSRVFVTRAFDRWLKNQDIGDPVLVETIRLADQGIIAAHLGGEIVKLRIAREGVGKSGGYRTIVAYKRGETAYFLEGFAKNVKDTLSPKDLERLKTLGKALQALSGESIENASRAGEVREVKEQENYDEEDHE